MSLQQYLQKMEKRFISQEITIIKNVKKILQESPG